jgi:putative ATP-dependent endonuclease of OLD family
LSQILQFTSEIVQAGTGYDPAAGSFDPAALSVVGIGDFANALLGDHVGVQSARLRLNTEYLQQLCFSGKALEGHISVSGAKGEDIIRLRLLLEKLDLELRDGGSSDAPPNRGLGSNNLLFMACELLLLAEDEGFPMLLIEEPEAHLHPQRQLRLMQFLQKKADETREDGKRIQIIVTTHSPNLASVIDLHNLVLLHGGQAFPLGENHTELDRSDYGFLRRFLDVTKANLFFARGLFVVEGDSENIIIPTIARLLGRDLTDHGISMLNVGGVGLRRYAKIYQRNRSNDPRTINLPVACLADIDVMPDCAPVIIGNVEPGATWPPKATRRWYANADFTAVELDARRSDIVAKASGQRVKTFVSDAWTFEYCLAHSGLAGEVWISAHLAKADERIHSGKTSLFAEVRKAVKSFRELESRGLPDDEFSVHVYAHFVTGTKASKAIAAQYLAQILEWAHKRGKLPPTALRDRLPAYLVEAIEYVCPSPAAAVPQSEVAAS